MKPAAAKPVRAPSTANRASITSVLESIAMACSAGTWNAGASPKNQRPTNVAVPVAIATGRNVATLTSGIIISMANITPPMGVLNVDAMPAPAPAAIRAMRWPAGMRIICPSVEPSAEPIWMIGPSRPTDAPLPIASAEANDLTSATTGRISPPL